MEKRSRRRTRDRVTQAASQGLSENEIGCARISMMARSTNALCKGRIQMRKTNPPLLHIRLATHGRSIQMGHSRHFDRGPATSGPPRSMDILSARRHVSKAPLSDMARLLPLGDGNVPMSSMLSQVRFGAHQMPGTSRHRTRAA
jgi:hypothetical protein